MSTNEGPGPVRLAILGAGPIGLDAALAGLEGGYRVDVYEAGSRPARHVRDWAHVRLFSPWSMNVSARMLRTFEHCGIAFSVDGDAFPTGRELVERLLDPLWENAIPASSLHLGERVIAVGREGALKHEEIGSPERARRRFRILLEDAKGKERVESADVVLDCTGKYGNPNSLGDGGIPAVGERAIQAQLIRRVPDLDTEAAEWSGRSILLVGAGHSAQTAAVRFAELSAHARDTRVTWMLRKENPDWRVIDNDPLPARRELVEAAGKLAAGGSPRVQIRTGGVIDELRPCEGQIAVRIRTRGGGGEELRVDRILGLVGGVGDHTLYRQLQVHECYATSGPMKLAAALLGGDSADCLAQESHRVDTLRNPEPNFFLLGDKSYGRNNTFLLRVGWQQVDDVFRELSRTP